MTTDALFLARLEKDLIRQTKSNSAHVDNDATGYYDRIKTLLGMLACRRLGMSSEAVACQVDALRRMRYAIKHGGGISSADYTGTDDDPLFGIGQGSGSSPAIWLALVIILLNCLDRLSEEAGIPGLSFHDPWDEIFEAWRVGAFVDDTNQGVMDPEGKLAFEELIEELRRAAQLWENLLSISGGALNLSKCSWTVQYWTWTRGRPTLLPMTSSDPPLLLTSGDNPEHHIIRQHSNATELKGLGVYMNFEGSFSLHAKNMRKKFDGMARRLNQSSMQANLAWIYYTSFYVPAVKHSLPVVSLTSTELHRVQSLMTATILNKLGYNRHFSHAVAFAPKGVFGVGLVDLRLEQGLCHIQSLLDYVGTDHKVGRVMVISLRHLQIEAGVSFDLLVQPTTSVSYLTNCWLVSLRKFCAEHTVSLTVAANRILAPSRIADCLLMDVALTMPFTKHQLIDLNLVRIYLRASSVSDIVLADGTSLHPWTWRGLRIPNRQGRPHFARQEAPTKRQLGLWRHLLRAFTIPGAGLTLVQPLGTWVAPSTTKWGAYVFEDNLYCCDPAHDSGERKVAMYFPRQLALANGTYREYYTEPPDWYAATVPALAVPSDLSGDQIYTASCASLSYDSVKAFSPSSDLGAWITELPPAERRLLSSISYDTCNAMHLLRQYLSLDCTLYVGTDGGEASLRLLFLLGALWARPGKVGAQLGSGGWLVKMSKLAAQ